MSAPDTRDVFRLAGDWADLTLAPELDGRATSERADERIQRINYALACLVARGIQCHFSTIERPGYPARLEIKLGMHRMLDDVGNELFRVVHDWSEIGSLETRWTAKLVEPPAERT